MEKLRFALTVVNLLGFIFLSSAIESPQYTSIHKELEFEIRLYRDTVWMSAPAEEISFEKATKDGFHRLFQYIEGANLNSSRVSMTKTCHNKHCPWSWTSILVSLLCEIVLTRQVPVHSTTSSPRIEPYT